MKKLLFLSLILIPLFINAQINDDFEDGNIDGWTVSSADTWAASSVTPLNGSYSLHHIFDNASAGHDQISHPFGAIDISAGIVTWQFQVKHGYAPSSGNNWGVFLFSDMDANNMYPQSGGNASGYVIGVNYNGETDDMLGLWEVSSGTETRTINTNSSWQSNVGTSQAVGIKVTRSTLGEWNLFWDIDGGFDNLVPLGSVTDLNQNITNYLGVYYEYSSAQDRKLWIDDISIIGTLGDDTDSQVSAGVGIEPSSISSLTDTQVEASIALDFNFADQGSGDTKPTVIDQIKITQGTLNEISDWTNAIAGAILTGADISGEMIGTVNADNITFAGNDFISVADGTNETYELKIWLKTDLSNVSDNDILDFNLSFSDIICDANGSSFGSGSIESGTENINIDATKIIFKTIPSMVAIGVDFSIKISATDENNNIDVDYTSPLTLSKASGTGNLTSTSGLTQNMVAGSHTWSDLQYDTEEIFTVSANTGSFPSITSGNIQCQSTIIYLDDDFEDNDIVNWQESTPSHWESSTDDPINGSYSLKQTFDNSASDIDIIAHPLSGVDLSNGTKAWRFQVKYKNSDPSGANNWSVFLMADNDETEMHPSGNINGYILGINFSSSDDIVKLSEITNGVETEIINTTFDWKNTNSNESIGFEIIRQTNGTWEVKIDEDGNFNQLVSYGTTVDITHTTANYFGIYYKYTLSQDQKLWIDDVYFGAEIPDLEAPQIDTVEVTSGNNLKITFNENITQASAETLTNFSVNNSIGNPDVATLSVTNHKIVNLHFVNQFTDSQEDTLSVQNIEDESGNILTLTKKTFIWKKIDAISASAPTDRTLDILFSKEIDQITSIVLTNYTVNNSIVNPESIIIDATNNKLVHLKFANKFTQAQAYIVNIANIEDVYGNVMVAKDINFTYYKANPYDIVINEIMFDVNPAPDFLPVFEYIEIYNNSNFDISLSGWKLWIGNSEHNFTNSTIPANGYAIICEEDAVSEFSALGMAIGIMGVSELTITGKRLIIRDNEDNIIEDITYSENWHTNSEKDDGGWSIERIDPTNLCGEEENWATTSNRNGGTPGSLNTTFATNPDNTKPTLISVDYISSKELKLTFSEKVEIVTAENETNYTLNSSINPNSATASSATTTEINLVFADNFTIGSNTLLIKNIEDNCGNIIDDYTYDFDYQLIYPKSVEVVANNQLNLYFSETVQTATAQTVSNYLVNGGIGAPYVALINNYDNTIVSLIFNNTFTLEETYTLTVDNVTDVNSNIMNSKNIDFTYYIVEPYDIIINEIMCDVNPEPISVPASVYVELYNTSNFDIDLTSWKFVSEGQSERTMPYVTLKSNEYLVLCKDGDEDKFTNYGNILPILASSDLTTTGRKLKLLDANNTIIEEVEYTNEWYNDEDKDNGGWSIERIDPNNICGEINNWKACENNLGGTPGNTNSVFATNIDNLKPTILSVDFVSSKELKIIFSEKVKVATSEDKTNYTLNASINPISATISSTTSKEISLIFTDNFIIGNNTLLIKNIEDNCGNILDDYTYNFDYQLLHPKYIEVVENNQLNIYFSEKVQVASAQTQSNYFVNKGIDAPYSSLINNNDSSIVSLIFNNNFTLEENYTLTIENIADVNNNIMNSEDIDFTYYVVKPYDIIINEIMCDINPAPTSSPEAIYVELYNTSNFDIDLTGWNFISEGQTPRRFPYITLKSNEYLTLCKDGDEDKFTTYGDILPILASSDLTTSGRKIQLLSTNNTIIEEIEYTTDWYNDTEKDDGGWSIERIDPNNFCGEINNWKACENNLGGTPGSVNSVFAENPDNLKPTVLSVDFVSSKELKLTFSEKVKIETSEDEINYTLNASSNPISATVNATTTTEISLIFTDNFTIGNNSLLIKNIEDNCGNTIDDFTYNFDYQLLHPKSIEILNNKELNIYFSEKVELLTAEIIANYSVNKGIGNPTDAIINSNDSSIVSLSFNNAFTLEENYTLTVENIADVNSNIMNSEDINFTYYKTNPYDIVINEIMFDVSPSPTALPVFEYIEVYNNSNFAINFSGWTLSIGDKTHIFPDSIIAANGYAIICEKDGLIEFSDLGMSMGIMDASELTITGKRLIIRDKNNTIIEDIKYSEDWHTDDSYDNGGYSIERIDPTNLCGEEENWASTANITIGGTPGSLNSVYATNPDNSKPTVLSVDYISSKELKIIFSEKAEIETSENIINYTLNETDNPVSANVSFATTSELNLVFTNNFDIGNNTLLIKNIKDNCGNTLDDYTYTFNYQLLYPKSVEVVENNQLRLHFSEKVEFSSAQIKENYLVNKSIGTPNVALINNFDSTIVSLLFENTFTPEETYNLTVKDVKDVNDNIMNSENIDFTYYIAKPYDIIINEIMCDINPIPVAVPEAKYVELYNTSNFDIDLTDWNFISEGELAKGIPYVTLKSNEYLILCEKDNKDLFEDYENVLAILSSNDLIASGRNLKLLSANKIIIEEVDYTSEWYNDEDKDAGGWSIERIDPNNYCGEINNWKACENSYGGTPGSKNSVFNSNQDNIAPDLLDLEVISSNYLRLTFNENVSYKSGSDTLNYSVNNGITYPNKAVVDVEDRSIIHLTFNTQFTDDLENTLSIENIKDNCGNTISTIGYDFTYKLINPIGLWVKDKNHLKIKFSETVDLLSGTDMLNFSADNGIGNPEYIARETADTTILHLEFLNNFPNGENIALTISGVKDINGNTMKDVDLSFSYYIPKKDDIAINEVLSYPNTGGSDFIELYNKSGKNIDLIDLQLATWDEKMDTIKSVTSLSETNMYFEPETYLVFTASKDGVLKSYMSEEHENIIELPSFPSYASDEGKVLLLYKDTTIIDEFDYNESMHFQLLDNKKGVSLERVNYDKPTQDASNWHSASEYVGFATPAYKNSQFSEGVDPGETPVTVEPYMFSPDNDGLKDYANINYKFQNPGHIATVIVFDAKGRQVKQLANNFLLSTEGTISWDGLYENGNLAPSGTYLIYFNVYDLNGNVEKYKIPVVSARKF